MSDLTLNLSLAGVNLQPEPKVDYAPRKLLTPLPTPGHFLLVIDNSSLEVFTTCPQSAYYKLVLRREAQAKNAALTFGGAIHEGLEALLKGEDEATQNAKIVSFFINHPTPLDEYRTVNNALAVLAAYRFRATLPDYSWLVQSDANGPIIERAFELPLGVLEVGDWIEMPWMDEAEWQSQPKKQGYRKVWVDQIHVAWSGRIDAVARCGDPLSNRIVDHKSGKVDPQEYQISNPVIGYVWAGQQLWPDLGISGFCLNALATKKPAAGCGMTDPGPRGGKSALEMFRSYFDYTPERIRQWEANTLAIVSDFIHCMVRDQFPRHTKWCFGKYGRCQYFDVCCQDDENVRQSLIQSDMFKPVTWNPTAGR